MQTTVHFGQFVSPGIAPVGDSAMCGVCQSFCDPAASTDLGDQFSPTLGKRWEVEGVGHHPIASVCRMGDAAPAELEHIGMGAVGGSDLLQLIVGLGVIA